MTAVSPRGTAHYAPCLKGAVDPPDSVDPRSGTATITIIDGLVVDGTISPDLLSQVREFLGLNRQVLLDYWCYAADGAELRLRAVVSGNNSA